VFPPAQPSLHRDGKPGVKHGLTAVLYLSWGHLGGEQRDSPRPVSLLLSGGPVGEALSVRLSYWHSRRGWVILVYLDHYETGARDHWVSPGSSVALGLAAADASALLCGWADWGEGWLRGELSDWLWTVDAAPSAS
jgi:hypothetical protein